MGAGMIIAVIFLAVLALIGFILLGAIQYAYLQGGINGFAAIQSGFLVLIGIGVNVFLIVNLVHG